MSESIKVRTHQRLYRGAKLHIVSDTKGHARSMVYRVLREGPSWTENGITTTIVEVEPSIIKLGDYTIEAIEVKENPLRRRLGTGRSSRTEFKSRKYRGFILQIFRNAHTRGQWEMNGIYQVHPAAISGATYATRTTPEVHKVGNFGGVSGTEEQAFKDGERAVDEYLAKLNPIGNLSANETRNLAIGLGAIAIAALTWKFFAEKPAQAAPQPVPPNDPNQPAQPSGPANPGNDPGTIYVQPPTEATTYVLVPDVVMPVDNLASNQTLLLQLVQGSKWFSRTDVDGTHLQDLPDGDGSLALINPPSPQVIQWIDPDGYKHTTTLVINGGAATL